MSVSSDSVELIIEGEEEIINESVEITETPKSQDFQKIEKNKDLQSANGSTTSTKSYTSSFEDEEEESRSEDEEDPEEMRIIMSALEKAGDNSGMKLQNKTFSEQKIRDIERTNSILMNRILSHNRRANRYSPAPKNNKISSSALNRQKQQRQIDHDNLILLRKIQTVKPFVVNHQKR